MNESCCCAVVPCEVGGAGVPALRFSRGGAKQARKGKKCGEGREGMVLVSVSWLWSAQCSFLRFVWWEKSLASQGGRGMRGEEKGRCLRAVA